MEAFRAGFVLFVVYSSSFDKGSEFQAALRADRSTTPGLDGMNSWTARFQPAFQHFNSLVEANKGQTVWPATNVQSSKCKLWLLVFCFAGGFN